MKVMVWFRSGDESREYAQYLEVEGVASCNFNQTVKVDPALPFPKIMGMVRMYCIQALRKGLAGIPNWVSL